MKNLLLLGGNGFIGKNIIEKALLLNFNISLLKRKSDYLDGELINSKLNIFEGDLKDTNLLKEFIINNKIDTIIHLVSSMVPSSSINKYYEELEEVVIPTFRLIDFVSKTEIKFVFFSSGGTIYGYSDLELTEDHKLDPINYYGYSKLIIEQYIQFKNRYDNLQFLILRPSNAFGKYQKMRMDQGFISVCINQILTDGIIEIWGNGKAIRDFIDVQSLADIVLKLLLLDTKNEIINVGTGVGYNLLNILHILEKLLEIKANVRFSEKRNVDLDRMVLNIDKLASLISIEFKPIEESISSYLNTIISSEK